MNNFDSLFLRQLSVNSAHYRDPLAQLPWHALSLNDVWLPPGALSLSGIPEFERQSEALQRRLSQYEFVNFIQAGLWLEGIFVARLSQVLHKTKSMAEYTYNLHEIREEAGHSLMFLKLMEQSGLHLPQGSFVRPWLADFLGRHAPLGTTLFWLALVIGEEIPNWLNRHVVSNGAAINPLIIKMCRLHIIDEARHIARSRHRLEHRLAATSAVTRALLTPVIGRLLTQFVRTFYLPSAAVYELAGLSPGHTWRELAQHNPTRKSFIAQCIRPTLHFFDRHGLDIGQPTA